MLVQIRMVALGRMRCPTLLDNAWSLLRSLSLSCLSGQKEGGTGSCRLRGESGASAFSVLRLRTLGSGAARFFLCISQDAVTGGALSGNSQQTPRTGLWKAITHLAEFQIMGSAHSPERSKLL